MFFNKYIWTVFLYTGMTFSDISQTHMNKETVNFLDTSVVLYQNWKIDKDRPCAGTNTQDHPILKATI